MIDEQQLRDYFANRNKSHAMPEASPTLSAALLTAFAVVRLADAAERIADALEAQGRNPRR